MKKTLSGGALALSAIFAAQPSLAQEPVEIIVESPLLHPAAGLMNEHMHESGEAMVGLRFERFHHSGRNRSGTDAVSDAEILAAGYSARTRSMTMDMLMLDLMFAPTDELTLMAMPHYMWHRMEMVGIDPMGGMSGHGAHGGHSLGLGEVHEHSTGGFGDTLVSASYRLARTPEFNAHATLGLWVPTGPADRSNPDGTFVHYGMQPGSGTWDVEPSVTVGGNEAGLGWGAQASYRWRAEKANESGFRFGDKARLTGWLSYLLGASVGATARLEYAHEGPVEGHYNAAHNHSAPADRQENYGGAVVSGALGLNWALPLAGPDRPQLGVELGVPLYQDLNGIQVPQDWRLSAALSRAF